MQFAPLTNKQSLCDDIDFLCGTTSASYPTLQKLRNVNVHYHDIARLIWEIADDWNYDDTNQSGLPKATRTMGQLSATYQIPTTAFSIDQVEVKDSNADWQKLIYKDYSELSISPEEFLETGGTPLYYALDGNYIRLFPPPHSGYSTLTSGLCLRLSRDVTEFASASITSPGFARPFHRILSYGAALDFEQDDSRRRLFLIMKDRLEKGLIRFYSHRTTESPNRIFPKNRRQWRQYL